MPAPGWHQKLLAYEVALQLLLAVKAAGIRDSKLPYSRGMPTNVRSTLAYRLAIGSSRC